MYHPLFGGEIGESCECSTESLRVNFEPLRQFLIAFRDVKHHSTSFRITQVLGNSQRLFTAFSQFAGQNQELADLRH
jgi:hypothetical protein